MNFEMASFTLEVKDFEKSLEFYQNALGFEITHISDNDEEDEYKIVTLQNKGGNCKLELYWNKNNIEEYNPLESRYSFALYTDDLNAAYEKHKEMGCLYDGFLFRWGYLIKDPNENSITILKR